MSQAQSSKYEMPHFNGFVMAAILVCVALFLVFRFFAGSIGSTFVLVPLLYCLTRFRTIQPNTALVGTLFGKYAGVLPRSGF
ncbi:hypothetical protein MIS45_11285 [Wielerella bovis]|uniref:hypothetical protein n=1 Tax=Wielerella bovis TaxID=2917790 RepID=UPI002018FB42|nr:hypothetical protein [Wielerella bovis]ULJ69303.1 hypothetical protein MIS45_11285 [Wielerella bovis]